ncbi:hypothetical protein JX266_011355 [Neoarthrinium moseri]|nr:hypothetical protein JX266_011355 [Neoarthrinium moseri]
MIGFRHVAVGIGSPACFKVKYHRTVVDCACLIFPYIFYIKIFMNNRPEITKMPKNLLGAIFLIVLVTPALSVVMSQANPGRNVKLTMAADINQTITLSIALTMSNLDRLEDKLKAVSTPGSLDYGKYLDKDEIDALFLPSANASAAVVNWLQSNGVEHISQQGSNVNFATTIAKANSLLSTRFAYYDVAGVQKLRTKQYSVPDEVANHIHLIHPTTYFGTTKPSKISESFVPVAPRATNATSNCSALVTPDCFRSAYGIEDYTPDPNSGSRVSFGSFINQSARLEDLHLFQQAYGIPLSNFTVELINGGKDTQDVNGSYSEGNLDAQILNAVSYPLPEHEFITGGSPPFVPGPVMPDAAHNTNEPYLEFYEYLLKKTNDELPQVISNSYGDGEGTVPPDYAKRVCDMIGIMGLRGISILQSSGDSGPGASCVANDGKNHTEFQPLFPASCPYITAVGGTQSWAPEVGWIGSGGGFSNYFAQGWYQADAVNFYLENGIDLEAKEYYTAGGFTNFSRRAIPDIAAHSWDPGFAYYYNNTQGLTGGTSASTPIVAGVIGLLHDARLRAGKPTMGFLNPFIYSLKHGPVTDVIYGGSEGCTGKNPFTGEVRGGPGAIIPYATWNNTLDWDPVTGKGIPNFQEMVKAALAII